MIINLRSFNFLHSELVHHFFNKLESIFQASFALNLKKHRYLVKLRLVGYVNEVILVGIILVRVKSKVYLECITLNVKLSTLNSTLIEGLKVPACSGLYALV